MKEIIIVGNIGSNAVRRSTADGREIMTFSVAVSSGDNSPIWFNCVSRFREKLFPYLVRGQKVAVTGDINPKLYNGALDLQISVDFCELCGSAPATDTTQEDHKTEPPF